MFQIKTPRDTLLAPLQAVCGIVERRHTLPILSNVLMEKHGELLRFIATDIEIEISTQSEVGDGADGAVTVGARKLLDILRALPDNGEVDIRVEEKRMVVRGGRSRFVLQTLPASDFPRMTEAGSEVQKFEFTQQQFRQLLSRVQYAMAQQDIRYYLNGMLLLSAEGELRAVATDGHRLAYASMPVEENLPRLELILPRKTVTELLRLLGESEESLQIELSPTQARFTFSGVSIVSKLIDGKFPDYERVIPVQQNRSLTIKRAELLQGLSRAAILTSDKFRGVRLVMMDGSLRIVAANSEQEEAQVEMEVDFQGDPLDVGFNVAYLLDVLNNVAIDTVHWTFGDASASAMMKIPGDEAFKYVVMPMRI